MLEDSCFASSILFSESSSMSGECLISSKLFSSINSDSDVTKYGDTHNNEAEVVDNVIEEPADLLIQMSLLPSSCKVEILFKNPKIGSPKNIAL